MAVLNDSVVPEDLCSSVFICGQRRIKLSGTSKQWEGAADTRCRCDWLCTGYRHPLSLERSYIGFLLLHNTAFAGCATLCKVPFGRLGITILIQSDMHAANMFLHSMPSTSRESTLVTEQKHEHATPVDYVSLFDFADSGRGR
jgi:hypothetical protein